MNQAEDRPQPLVAVVMGSKSDYDTMAESLKVFKAFEIPFECRVISAHRTPDRAHQFAELSL